MTPLNSADLKVLWAAERGELWQSNRTGKWFIRSADGRADVTPLVQRLTDWVPPLLELGTARPWITPWVLTDAGREALAKRTP